MLKPEIEENKNALQYVSLSQQLKMNEWYLDVQYNHEQYIIAFVPKSITNMEVVSSPITVMCVFCALVA